MALELSDKGRPFVHARRLTNIGEILKGENKKKAGKRREQKRPRRPLNMDMTHPMARLAWNLYENRRKSYLNDINHRVRELGDGVR